jgi:mycothiol S-conjugate amidase
MSLKSPSILAIFAHPDDEIGVGSTLAHYSHAGVATTLVCASRGEAATIYCSACATSENLAEVRTHELACACEQLGVPDLRWLDWPDGGIKNMSHDAAVGQIVALIRDIQPSIILTHPENGLYPHPDHLAIWEFTRAAFEAAADPERYPDAGAPWAAARLFTRALPQSFFDAVPEFAQYRVELNGEQLPFYATPDEEIDVVMNVTNWIEHRISAWECHCSQHNPNSPFVSVPAHLQQEMAKVEYFVLDAAHVPLPDGRPHNDLLTGLTDEEDEANPDYISALRTNLAIAEAHLAVYWHYLRMSPEEKLARLLRTFSDSEKESVYLLSTALRRTGTAAGKIEALQPIVDMGKRHRNTITRLEFLRTSKRAAVARCEEQVNAARTISQRDTWNELLELVQAQLALIPDLDK